MQQRGAGEILLTSMDKDGTQSGFDIPMTKLAVQNSKIPVIASGGAGDNVKHFVDIFQAGLADAALAASIFHYDSLPVPALKSLLHDKGLDIRILV